MKDNLLAYKDYKWIVKDPNYLNGNLAIRGTRLPVHMILQCLAEGMTLQEINDTYTAFPQEALAEALLVAADAVREADVAA